MPNESERDHQESQPEEPRPRAEDRYMPRPMIAASVLVIIALLALATAPAVMLFRGERPGKLRSDAIQQAARHTSELNANMYKSTAEFRGYLLTGKPEMLRRAVEARNDQLRILDHMDTCMYTLGPLATSKLARLRGAVAQWHAKPDSVAAGLLSPQAYRAGTEQQAARRDSAFAALDHLEHEIDRVAVENLEQKRAFAAQLRVVSIALGFVALASAAVVAWFLLRQRALAMGLERAATTEEKLRKVAEGRREEVERVTESRQRLMRGFTHDVKNPLNAADGYLQLMQQGLAGPLNEPQQFKIIKVRNGIHNALALIDDLLDLERAERGEIEVSRVNVDLRLLVEEAVADFRDLAETKGLQLKLELPDTPLMVETDPKRVRQILGNLLSNAVKYTDQGVITVRAESREDEERGKHAVCQVIDTGPGIPPDRHEHIFHEFTRLEPGQEHGAGVGLAISRRLARALEGDIHLVSVVGEGSTFTLVLPAAKLEAAAGTSAQAA